MKSWFQFDFFCCLSFVSPTMVGLDSFVSRLRNFQRPKPQVCVSEWGGILGAVENVATSVGC